MPRISLGLLLAAILIIAGCPTNSGTTQTGAEVQTNVLVQGGTLRLPLTIAGDDPVLTGLDFSDPRLFALARCIGLPLVRSDAEGKLTPGFAKSWESDDFVSWTLKLDSVPAKPDDPAYGAKLFDTKLRSLLSADMASLRAQVEDLIVGAKDYSGGKATAISGIHSDGDTLTIELTRPYAQFPLWLSQPGLYLVAANPFVDEEGDSPAAQLDFAPFKVDAVTLDSLALKANPESLRGKPVLDEVDFVLEPELKHQVELFLTGDLDAANLPGNKLEDLNPEDGRIVKLQTAEMILGLFNLSHFPWQDSRFQTKLGLRQALNYGLNLPTVAEESNDCFEPWPHFFPEAMKEAIPAGLIQQPTFPLEEKIEDARMALRAADHWQGNHLNPGMDLSYLRYQRVNSIAVSVLEFWNDISVKMRPHETTMDDVRVRVGLGTHEIVLYRQAPAYADPLAIAYPLLYSSLAGLGGNWEMLKDDEVDRMIRDIQATDDNILRQKRLQQLSRYLEDNALQVYIGYATPSIVLANRVAGLKLDPYDFDASLSGEDFTAIGVTAE